LGKLSNIINIKSSQANITNYHGKENKKEKKEAGHFEKVKDPPSNILESGHFYFF